MNNPLIRSFRRSRVALMKIIGTEPSVPVLPGYQLEHHGNDVCYWEVPVKTITSKSVVVDVGLGEDISFFESIIKQYGCVVNGFDPTPKAINYVRNRQVGGFVLHELGLAAVSGSANFYLPNERAHVSGSIVPESHVGLEEIEVQLLSIEDLFKHIGVDRIDLLKIDIEGAEFGVLESESFARNASRVGDDLH